ncbi:MAG: hypothetical protein J07HX64_02510 [halophilic archaeon J07HX64]|nr:MAG: hypothetical protein J07HX64_02510 [halophilic archaeon J07HX64]
MMLTEFNATNVPSGATDIVTPCQAENPPYRYVARISR